MKLTIREILILFGIVCLILLTAWLRVRSSPEDRWPDEHISYRVVGSNGILQEKWSRSNLFVRNQGGRCLPFIVAAQAKVFVIGRFDQPGDTTVLALDAVDGTLLWYKDNPDGNQYTGLYVTSSTLYLGSGGNAKLFAYDLNTDQIFWATHIPLSRYIDCFRVVDNLIYVETNNARYLIQANTGKILHEFDGMPTKNELRELPLQLGLPPTTQIKLEYFGNAVLTEDTIFRAGEAFDRHTENRLWKMEGVISNIAVTKTAVYLLTKDRRLLGLNPHSGEVVASVEFEPKPTTIGVHGYDNAFYVTADEETGLVYAFLGDGAQIFAFKVMKR